MKESKMKKILALFVCLFVISAVACADDDRPIRFNQLPASAQEYVQKYFPQEKVALCKMESDLFNKKYEVIFTSSIKLEFYKNGDWKEIDCKYSAVPESVIPAAILRYVKANYPEYKIVKIEKDSRDYEAKLTNGIELKFDKKFNLINIDN